MVKPFAEADPDKIETTLSDQYSSIRSNSWKSHKSEDDSPQRRRMMRSPRKKNNRRGYGEVDLGSQRAMERLLNESDIIDSRLKMQLQYIQEIRRDT